MELALRAVPPWSHRWNSRCARFHHGGHPGSGLALRAAPSEQGGLVLRAASPKHHGRDNALRAALPRIQQERGACAARGPSADSAGGGGLRSARPTRAQPEPAHSRCARCGRVRLGSSRGARQHDSREARRVRRFQRSARASAILGHGASAARGTMQAIGQAERHAPFARPRRPEGTRTARPSNVLGVGGHAHSAGSRWGSRTARPPRECHLHLFSM